MASEADVKIKATPSLSGDTPLELELDERRDSLVGKIAAEIARAISDGELQPGADLNSVELASRFGTSRTPVREALMLLEKEGLVEIPPRRRPRVAAISLAELEELYQIRATLNAMMARLFVHNATEGDLTEMAQIIEDAKQAASSGHIHHAMDLVIGIHQLCLDRCGNGSLVQLLGRWKMRMSVRRLGVVDAAHLRRALLDNERFVIACMERDAELAASLIQAMTLFGLSAILKQQRSRAAGEDRVVRRTKS